jgi:hypothetical protein
MTESRKLKNQKHGMPEHHVPQWIDGQCYCEACMVVRTCAVGQTVETFSGARAIIIAIDGLYALVQYANGRTHEWRASSLKAVMP